MSNTENTLIFLHIPKTAGSTFHSVLNSRYGRKGVVNVFGARYADAEIARFINTPMEEKQDICLLKGHMPYGLHKHLPSESKYICVLRNPVERVISQYYYIKKNAHNPLHETVEKGGMSLSDFVSSGVAIGMNNGQCRFLNGDIDDYGFNECDETLFESVKEHIKTHFLWLGVTERFDESLLVLAKCLNWDKPPYYLRENVSKVRRPTREVDPKDIELIKQFNSLDIKLYELASDLLDHEIKAMSDFDARLAHFKDKNATLQRRWSWLPDRWRQLVV